MMRKWRTLLTMVLGFVMVGALGFGLAACGEEKEPDDSGKNNTETTTVYYLSAKSANWATYADESSVPATVLFKKSGENYTLTLDMEEGDSFTVNKVGSENKIGYSAIFSSRKELAAGENGAIDVKATGQYALTLDASESLTYSYTEPKTEVTVTKVEITRSVTSLVQGAETTFEALVTYSDQTTGTEVTWSSSNPAVATVSETGVVLGVSNGTATITATAGDKSATVDVTVSVSQAAVGVKSVELDEDELLLEKGESRVLHETVLPENASNKAVMWSSNRTSVATVSNGRVTAVGIGEAIITVTTRNGGKTAQCKVTVRQPVSDMIIDEAVTVVAGGNAKTVNINILPANATNKSYTVETTSGADNIQLDDNKAGQLTITGVKKGSASLKVTSVDNPEVIKVCAVTVEERGTPVADLSSKNIDVNLLGTTKVTAVLDGADIESVEWQVGNKVIASVTPGGTNNDTATIKGEAFGTTTITATINGQYTVTGSVLVTSSFFYITGLGGKWEVASQATASSKNTLLQQTGRGVYQLSRHFAKDDNIQILHANLDTNWDLAIRGSAYYQADAASSDYVSLSGDAQNVVIHYSGNYTVLLDMTGASTTFTVKMDTIDVTGVELNIAEGFGATLTEGDVDTAFLTATVTPAFASYDEDDDIEWWYDSYYAGWLELDAQGLSCTVRLVSTKGTSPVSISIYISVRGNESHFDIGVIPQGASKNAVTEINFDQAAYNVEVGKGWSTTVTASVNQDATVKTVVYSTDDENVSVDQTGKVTAVMFGTYTIKAASADDPQVTTTTQVTFYSTGFYLAGILNGTDAWNTNNAGQYGFKQGATIKEWKLEDIELKAADQFKIVYSGIPESGWDTYAINSNHVDMQNSDNVSAGDIYGISIGARGKYSVTIDLSGSLPVVTVKKTGDTSGNMDDFGVTVSLYVAGDAWIDKEKSLLTQVAGTISPSRNEMTIEMTYTYTEDTEFPSIQFWVEQNGATTNYNANYTATKVEFDGSKFSTSQRNDDNMWKTTDGYCQPWYGGTVAANTSFKFTFTFNNDGLLLKVTID